MQELLVKVYPVEQAVQVNSPSLENVEQFVAQHVLLTNENNPGQLEHV